MYVHADPVRSIYFIVLKTRSSPLQQAFFCKAHSAGVAASLASGSGSKIEGFVTFRLTSFIQTFILRRWMIYIYTYYLLNFHVVNTVSRLHWLERCHCIFFVVFQFECMFISEAFFSHRTLKRRPWRKLPQKRLPGPERLVPWCWLFICESVFQTALDTSKNI